MTYRLGVLLGDGIGPEITPASVSVVDAALAAVGGEAIDWVDPVTAEVKPVDGIQNALMTHCVKQPDFLTSQTALVEAVFRLFLTNGNNPMSSRDLGERLNRPAETILRTLAGARVYKGIRPYSA